MNQEQYENSCALYDVIKAKIAKNEPEEILNHWVQPCGTYGCVAGDFVIRRLGNQPVNESQVNFANYVARKLVYDVAYDSFNIFGFHSADNRCDFYLFGRSSEGTLQERLDYVASQIKANGYSLPDENVDDQIDIKSMITDIMEDESVVVEVELHE